MSIAESIADTGPEGRVDAGVALDVHDLSKRFGERQALRQLSLSLRSGEILGLIGANGGGKTTTLRILAGLLPPDAGRGTVLGHDVIRAARSIRQSVGYMSQRFSLYSNLSVSENLRFRAEVFAVARPRAAVDAVIERFGLRAFASTPAERLSGGWARLVQLAAALVHEPRLLLLDEPTAGLDATARQAVWQQVARLAAEGAALVLCTHDLADAQRCSRIVFLAEGVVRGSGSPASVARATRAAVFTVRGHNTLLLIERIRSLAAVLAAYPAGESLRVLVEPGRGDELMRAELLSNHAVEPVAASLEDALLEWSHTAMPAAP